MLVSRGSRASNHESGAQHATLGPPERVHPWSQLLHIWQKGLPLPLLEAHSCLMTTHSWDTLIIGGGVAGLSAAQMLGRSRRRTLVIDGGQPRNRYADHMHGVLGLDG